MEGESIHLRVEQKLLALMQKEANYKKIGLPELVREVFKARYTRKAKKEGKASYEDFFSRGRGRTIKSYEDYFSEKVK